MTNELFWLTLSVLLAGSLWIPFVVGVNMHLPKEVDPFQAPPDVTVLPNWVQRANRAHLNSLEQIIPFAVLVLIAHAAGISNGWTVWTCITFFCLRVLHAVGMITGLARMPLRPIIFTSGWICIVIVAVQLIWH